MVINGQRSPLDPTRAVLCRPGEDETFEFDRDAPCAHLWVSVAPDSFTESIKARVLAQARTRTDVLTIESLLRTGLSAQGTEFLNTLALTVIEAFLAPTRPPKSEPIDLAVAFIDAQLHQPLSLNQIAASAFVTPQHLTRLFRANLGITPAKYLWQERTRRGIELLSSTGLTFAEISLQLGFQSPFHFSRLVRKSTGKSPRELRKTLWEN